LLLDLTDIKAGRSSQRRVRPVKPRLDWAAHRQVQNCENLN